MRFHYKRLAVSAKIPAVILFLTGESEPVLRPDEGRIGWDCIRQNRARQFFPESPFYGEILAKVVGGCGILDGMGNQQQTIIETVQIIPISCQNA